MLSNALRDRFGFVCRLEFYEVEELKKIVARTAQILSVSMDDAAVEAIAARARGTPRIANRLVRLAVSYTHLDVYKRQGCMKRRRWPRRADVGHLQILL